MDCLICSAAMASYFQKRFDSHGLCLVDYRRCTGCGFVLSKTHRET